MDRPTALTRLPVAHAVALELDEAGLDDEVIAERLSIAAASVQPLLAVARAKLANIMEAESTAEPATPAGGP